jgi:hypothetical protein
MGSYYSLGPTHRCVPSLDIDNANIIMHGIISFKVLTYMGVIISISLGLFELVIPPTKTFHKVKSNQLKTMHIHLVRYLKANALTNAGF